MRIGIVGAGGLVGQAILHWIVQLKLPVQRLKLIGRSNAPRKTLTVQNKTYVIDPLDEKAFLDLDLVFFTAGQDVSKTYAPQAIQAGCWVIDNTSAFRYNKDIPLIIPEINSHLLSDSPQLIANPNCSTIQLLLAIKPLYDAFGLHSLDVVTYQSISGAGKKAFSLMKQQALHALATDQTESMKTTEALPTQSQVDHNPLYAFNVIPWIDQAEAQGYCREEMKIVWETQKILNDKNLAVNPTVARVPVFNGHAEAVHLITKTPVRPEEALALWKAQKGIRTHINCPTPRAQAAGNELVWIGRVRQHLTNPMGLNFWCVSDNLIRGAAYNAVAIAIKIEAMLCKASI
jgi:aspartate-semialdehyde dehydrogenase